MEDAKWLYIKKTNTTNTTLEANMKKKKWYPDLGITYAKSLGQWLLYISKLSTLAFIYKTCS